MLVKVEDLIEPKVNVMIVGPPGSGKTQSLASLYFYNMERLRKQGKDPKEHAHRMRVYDLDRDGSLPLIRIAQQGTGQGVKPSLPGGWLDDLEVYRYRLRGQFGQVKHGQAGEAVDSPLRTTAVMDRFTVEWNQLYDMLDPKTGYWADPPTAPAIIVIDSATALEKIITDFIAAVRQRELNSAEANERARFADWGAIKDKELEFVQSGVNLPCHFVYLVHDELREQQVSAAPKVTITPDGTYKETPATIGTGDIFVVPALTGNLRDTLAQEFTAVLYSRYNNNQYSWIIRPQVEGSAMIRCAKTRTKDDLPTTIEQDFRRLLI